MPVDQKSTVLNNQAYQQDSIAISNQLDFNSNLSEVIRSIPSEELEHMQRVGALTERLISQAVQHPQYKIFSEQFQSFGNSAFYHDIGKAWIPSQLLLKEGSLSSSEFENVRKHPLYAEKYIKSHLDLFKGGFYLRQMIFNAAVFHHERWDGSGYPYGLKEEEIPLIARLTSVCDVYDAITNERSYKKARSHEEACSEIKKWAGRQFDPEIAEIFLSRQHVVTQY